MEQFEKDFITSCETLLIEEGNKLCEEVLVFLDEDEEFLIEKACTFCIHFIKFMDVNKLDTKYTLDLKERCKKYLDNVKYFNRFKYTLYDLNDERKMKNIKKLNVDSNINFSLCNNPLKKMTGGLKMGKIE